MSEKRYIVSVSGGKDSTATMLHMKELGLPFHAAFFDVGWDEAGHHSYLDYLEHRLDVQIERRVPVIADLPDHLEAHAKELEGMLGHHSAFVRLILKKGMFPSRKIRFCTVELKVKEAARLMREHHGEGVAPVNVVGVRADESHARSQLGEWELSPQMDAMVWRPLIRWSYADVVNIHKRHGVTPNPLYLRGSKRVGCWPCIQANKPELRLVGQDLRRIAVIRRLEEVVADSAKDRHIKKGKPLDEFHAPGFFQRSRKKEGARPCVPIDEHMEWARTARGSDFEDDLRRKKMSKFEDVRAFHKAAGLDMTMVDSDKVVLQAVCAAGDTTVTFASELRKMMGTAPFRASLMLEELAETLGAMARDDIVEIADGLADLVYVTLGTADAYGIPFDEVFAEVHRSNMAKLIRCSDCESQYGEEVIIDGGWPCNTCLGRGLLVLRDKTGKVKKPKGWTPPNIGDVLLRHNGMNPDTVVSEVLERVEAGLALAHDWEGDLALALAHDWEVGDQLEHPEDGKGVYHVVAVDAFSFTCCDLQSFEVYRWRLRPDGWVATLKIVSERAQNSRWKVVPIGGYPRPTQELIYGSKA